jgi:hypothetical protein
LRNTAPKKFFAEITNDVGNHENDPFVVKKTNDAKEFIKKYGLPKHLTKEQLGLKGLPVTPHSLLSLATRNRVI